MKRRLLLARSLCGVTGLEILAAGSAHAQIPAVTAPRQPVEMTLPFRLSGPLIRRMLDHLGALLPAGHHTDERPGANGLLAIRHVLQEPTGSARILVSTTSTTFFSALFAGNEKFVRSQALAGIGRLAEVPLVLLAHPSSAHRLDALRRWDLKAYQGLSLATSPPPGFLHFAALLLEEITATSLLKVPYPGGFIVPLLKGEVDLAMLPLDGALPFIDSGQALPVALAARKRPTRLGKVPTFSELGRDLALKVSYDLLVSRSWTQPAMQFMNQALNQVLGDEGLRAQGASQALQLADPHSLADHERMLREEDNFWEPRIATFAGLLGARPAPLRP